MLEARRRWLRSTVPPGGQSQKVCYQTNNGADWAVVKTLRQIRQSSCGYQPVPAPCDPGLQSDSGSPCGGGGGFVSAGAEVPAGRREAAGADVSAASADLTALLRPVRQGNAFEETVERLLSIIKLGVVAPGERFPAERELAAQLGISRLTLREAIHELQEAGYICSRRGRTGGTFVTYTRPEPDSAELRRLATEDPGKLADALTFRLAVESGAADALASHFAAAADERARATLLARLAEVTSAGPQDYRRLDTLFHLSIAELTGSGLLAAACADARMRLNDLLNAIPVLQRNIDHTGGQHEEIVEAILAGDSARARTAVAEHLAGTAALLRGFLG